jgi:hypothetical protein
MLPVVHRGEGMDIFSMLGLISFAALAYAFKLATESVT